MNPKLLFLISIINIISTSEDFPNFILKNLFRTKSSSNPSDLYLREWLNKLVIDIPNDLIKNETKGYIEDLTIYNISIESLITSRKKNKDNKVGLEITLRNAALNIKGKYIILSKEPKNFLAEISYLSINLPFYLVKNESGLITEVDTSGFTIDLDKAQIELDLDTIDVIQNVVKEILKGVLKLIKKDVIEKNIIQILNTKLEEMFGYVNELILKKTEPEKLNIIMDKNDLADVRESPVLGSISYLLTNITGINGPLSLNSLVNLFTNDTGIIKLKTFFKEEINFKYNLTDKNNLSLAQFEFAFDDLNVGGLNTWKEFNALEPYDALQLKSNINLGNLTLNVSFALRIKLENNSKLVKEETILYEKAQIRINLQNNKLNAFLQFPFNNKRVKEYTDQECVNLDCVVDLADSNGTGITAMSLKETFNYILLEVKEGGELEEDLFDTIEKISDLFFSSFNDQIGILINNLINTTAINLVNNKLNEFLSSKNCPGVQNPEYNEIDYSITSMVSIGALVLFFLTLFFPYLLGKSCKKNKNIEKQINLIEEENNNRIAVSELKSGKEPLIKPKYCIDSIKINWIKEFGRIDPSGASLFLNPRVPLFFRIFIPFAILFTIALFASSNSGIGASVFVVFNLGRRIQLPSMFDFGLVNSVHDMWVAGSKILSALICAFSGIWPYMKLILMLISFCTPTSILSHKRREKILIILDATGKFSFLDSYVMMMMLVAFHFHVEIPVTAQSKINKGSVVDVFVYAAYGFVTLIVGTIISLILSHIITHLHRHLDEHPDQNKGEKAESYKSIMSFAKGKCLSDTPFRIFISSMQFFTLGLVVTGLITECFSFYFHGLAGYALNILDYPQQRGFSIIQLGLDVRGVYENPTASEIIFTQLTYFLTILVIPIAFLINLIILWFVPMPRKYQKIIYSIGEILNAWSCIDVFVIAIIAGVAQIGQFAKFLVGDKCDFINPIIEKYFSKTLEGHDTCFEVQTYLSEGCWFFFAAAISFFIASFVILKVCRNALNERLPDNVKEYLRMKKQSQNSGERISNISDINDFASSRDSLIEENLDSKKILEEDDNL